jgi:hypothetical protein
MSTAVRPHEIRISGHSRTGNLAGNWCSFGLFVLLVFATTAKFVAFINALSFGTGYGGTRLGLVISVAQAGLWWWMARGLGVAGIAAA